LLSGLGFRRVTLLRFHTTVTGSTAVVSLSGELDVAGSNLLEDELSRLAADHDPRSVVLDLRDLDFMDSTGLRLVVMADADARAAGRRFAVVRGGDSVQRVFEITRMVDRLEFIDRPEDVDAGGAIP